MPIPVLIILLFLAYILTRKVRVSITKEEKWRVELHFTLCKIRFDKLLNKNKSNKDKENDDDKRFKRRLILHRIFKGLRHAELDVRKFNVPIYYCDTNPARAYLSQYKYHVLVAAVLSFLKSKVKKLTVRDNAITLCSDAQSDFLDVSIKARLFHTLSTLVLIWLDEKKMKRDLGCRKIR